MVVVDMPRSVRANKQRSRNMGLCRECSVEMVKRMVQFPSTVMKYMEEKGMDIHLCLSSIPGMPWRMKKEGWPEALQVVIDGTLVKYLREAIKKLPVLQF
jgi:hypothetical protein